MPWLCNVLNPGFLLPDHTILAEKSEKPKFGAIKWLLTQSLARHISSLPLSAAKRLSYSLDGIEGNDHSTIVSMHDRSP